MVKSPKGGRPRGSRSSYSKTRRRSGDVAGQKRVTFRFASDAQRAFAEEAASETYPDIFPKFRLTMFLNEAVLEKAEKVNGRSRPALPAEEAATEAVPA